MSSTSSPIAERPATEPPAAGLPATEPPPAGLPAAELPAGALPADTPALSRRGFLRAATVAGGGLVALGAAACAPASLAAPSWSIPPKGSPAAPPTTAATPAPSASPDPSMSHGPASPGASGSPQPSGPVDAPAGWSEHDVVAKTKVDRFLAAEYSQVGPLATQTTLEPRMDGDVKVFELTIEHIRHRIDAQGAELDALGYNGTWPGPTIRVTEGDKVRALFRNDLRETTGVHFHGQRLPNAVDGVPMITQDPIVPGASWTYEFTARTPGSHMYHSHHNATDQVGRGLLGAFIVDPKDPNDRPDRLYGVSQDIVWISNDTLGGFTINGRGFPATYPIVATLGERILVRFMNEGIMMHPWHLHGMPFRVVARDGYPLGSAAFTCDTLGVNPGERWDVVIDCDEPGVWAFHCHILTHAEAMDGMFGMVTALIVQEPGTALQVLPPLAELARGTTASVPFTCTIPGLRTA